MPGPFFLCWIRGLCKPKKACIGIGSWRPFFGHYHVQSSVTIDLGNRNPVSIKLRVPESVVFPVPFSGAGIFPPLNFHAVAFFCSLTQTRNDVGVSVTIDITGGKTLV
jgi:hypothetical protein